MMNIRQANLFAQLGFEWLIWSRCSIISIEPECLKNKIVRMRFVNFGAREGPNHHRQYKFISHKVFVESFWKSQLPHKSVNLFFTSVKIKDKLRDLCEKCLWQNNFVNTFCEKRVADGPFAGWHVWFFPPWRQPRDKSQANLPQMLPPGGSIWIGVD